MEVSLFPFSVVHNLIWDSGNLWIWLILFENISSEWTYWLFLSYCIVIIGTLKDLPCTLSFHSSPSLEFLFEFRKFRENKGLKMGSNAYCFPSKGKIMGERPNHTFFWCSDHLLVMYLALSTTISVGKVQNFNFSSFQEEENDLKFPSTQVVNDF